MGWTGESHLQLLILPQGVAQAISYDRTNEGDSYWPVTAGRYELLGYNW